MKTTYKKIIYIGLILSIGFGVFLHFAYDIFGSNSIVGLIAPINESVWEHLKLILIPFTLFSIILYFVTKQKFSNMLLTTLFGNVVGMFVTVILYYLGLYLFKMDSMLYNIISYILGMICAFYILYLGIYNKDFLEETTDSSLIATCALTLLFAVFALNTYFPIKADITKDPVTNTYGIQKIV